MFYAAGLPYLLTERPPKELKRYPKSMRVNRGENNSRECMEPLKGIGSSGSLESGPKKAKEKAYEGIN
jgi:hypothetical protein